MPTQPFRLAILISAHLLVWASAGLSAAASQLNILFVTVDDMNCDSMGAYGCELQDTTPHMDQLASEGLRFEYAHVQVGNCMPSRNVLYSGRYPHNNRVEGFYQVKDPDYPHLVDLMKAAGYFTAIRGKVSHSTPYHPYAWDLVLDDADATSAPKNVQSYFTSTQLGIAAAGKAEKPFCLVVNISDPHKPFYGQSKQGRVAADSNKPSRVFTADEAPVPGFLPDHPEVKQELALYYSTVRRADDCLGMVLKALNESGQRDNTVVMFLSDHGMPLPFAKTQLYHHSTRTPWIVRWPGVTQPNRVDNQHMISAIDFLPTLLDITGQPHPLKLEGRSFLPLLKGQSQAGRDVVFKEYNENAGGGRHPMRAVQSKRFVYLFNPWANGDRVMKTATTGTRTYRVMQQLAKTDPAVAARLDLFEHRVLEEFYDCKNDPDALHNLIDDPRFQAEIQRHRTLLEQWMERSGDHLLETFQRRDDANVRATYMARVEQESTERRKNKRQNKPANARAKRQAKLFQLAPPAKLQRGAAVVLKITHTLPPKLGEQLLHVTIKDGQTGKRIARQVRKVQGQGTLALTFPLPADLRSDSLSYAAFVGADYQHHLQHTTSGPQRFATPK